MEKSNSRQAGIEAAWRTIGIVGVPPRRLIRQMNRQKAVIHDLDALLVRTDLEAATGYLPKAYCAILRTVVLNALNLQLDAVVIDTGPGKCDNARHVATILQDCLAVPVLETCNLDADGAGYPICRSRLPLREKMQRLTDGVKLADPPLSDLPPSQPIAGFWGVPPRDFSLLEFFPEATHIYGWSRCMENKTPADRWLEAYYRPDIPTVFFAQSFCAKTALSQHLARRHPNALYLDTDVTAGSSAKAKIQAFLELSGVFA